MKSKNWKNILKVTAAAAFLVVAGSQSAKAGELVNNWNYAYDSAQDGWTGGAVGANSLFEFYGMAVSEQDDNIFIAFNSNLPIGGESSASARGGSIGWGDLFFNFSGKDLKTANEEGSLFGIRFADSNDSGVSQTGVYKNVTGQNVAQYNSGFNDLKQHSDHTKNSTGSASTMGELAQDDAYFASLYDADWSVPNVISSGEKVGDISMLDNAMLAALGLDNSRFAGNGATFGFSIARSLLPTGSFVAHVLAECINDGMALVGNLTAQTPPVDEPPADEPPADEPPVESEDPTSVPEPSSIISLSVLGLMGVGSKLRKRS